MTKLVLRLLGPTETKFNENRIDPFPADKVSALLAFLAVESGVAHPRASLAVLLWPEHSAAKAQGNLRQTLYRLRSTLDQHAPGLSDMLLVVTRRTIMLNSEYLWLDVAELLVWSAKCASEKAEATLDQCRDAADLYRGEFMAGLTLKDAPEFDEWQSVVRERCFHRAQLLLHALGEHYAREKMYGESVRMARRQITLDPCREKAHRQLISGLARSGRVPEALVQFESCRQMLLDEWGAEPSPETVTLYQTLRDQTLTPAEPDRLRAPQLPVRRVLHGFPQQSIDFVGRDRELNLVLGYFAQPSHKFMTIVSMGGMGRRRLAIEAARRLVQEAGLFAHGAVYVALDQVSTADEALATIARAVGLAVPDGALHFDQVVQQMRSFDLLLVLSGLECLADSRAIIGAILAQTTDIRILATSLFSVKLPGERTLVLSGLDYGGVGQQNTSNHDMPSTNSAGGGTGERDLPAAATMFVRAAQKSRPNWTPTPSDIGSIMRICTLVDGMPLALSIAAGWTRMMDLPSIVREIEADDKLLQLADEDEWNRPRSIQAVFEAVWQHLPEDARRVLAQTSLFQNGATVQAVYAVSQADRQTLAVLVDRGLLRWQDNGRTGMVRLLQHVARRRLQAMPTHERLAIHRYIAYYLTFIQEAKDLLSGIVIDDDWLARIVAELGNIRQAWRWSVDHTDMAAATDVFHLVCLCFERSAQYHDALGMIDICLGRASQWQAKTDRVDDVDDDDDDKNLRRLLGVLSVEKGWFLWRLNRYVAARAAVTRSLDLLPASGQQSDLSFAYLTLGLIEDSQGRYADARTAYAQCLEICEADGDHVRTGRVLNFLGAVTRILGGFDDAVRLHEQSLAIGRHLSDRWGITSTLHNLGIALHELGRIERARALFIEAIQAGTSIGDPWAIHVAKISLADLEIDAQQFDTARQLLNESLAWAEDVNNLWGMALATTVLGRLGRIDATALHVENTLSQALDLWRRVGDGRGIARTLCELGRAALAQQRYTASAELLSRALEQAVALQANALCAEILAGLALLLAESHEPEQATRIAMFLNQYAAASTRIRGEITDLPAESNGSSCDETPHGTVPPVALATLEEVVCLAQQAAAQFFTMPTTKQP